MRTIALVGRSPDTKELSLQSSADEFWGVGVVYRDNVAPLDRLYELHPAWMIQHETYARGHWDWLCQDRGDMLIYMMEQVPEIPNSIEYPLADVVPLCGGFWRNRDGELAYNPYFTSSIDYMIAHAVYEQVDRIEVYGIDLGIETEYIYQRPGMAFWLGQALARGIEVIIPHKSPLYRGGLYAYEGAQMVTRHKLDELLREHTNFLAKQLSTVNALEGTASEIRERWEQDKGNAELQAVFQASWQDLQDAKVVMWLHEGAKQALRFLLDECDMQEPEHLNLANPYSRINIPTPRMVRTER